MHFSPFLYVFLLFRNILETRNCLQFQHIVWSHTIGVWFLNRRRTHTIFHSNKVLLLFFHTVILTQPSTYSHLTQLSTHAFIPHDTVVHPLILSTYVSPILPISQKLFCNTKGREAPKTSAKNST